MPAQRVRSLSEKAVSAQRTELLGRGVDDPNVALARLLCSEQDAADLDDVQSAAGGEDAKNRTLDMAGD